MNREDHSSAPTEVSPRVSTRIIENVEVELEALLGATRMTVAALTALKSGDAISLDTPLNHTVQLRLNDALVARGELVSVGDKFGVRLTEIVEWPE